MIENKNIDCIVQKPLPAVMSGLIAVSGMSFPAAAYASDISYGTDSPQFEENITTADSISVLASPNTVEEAAFFLEQAKSGTSHALSARNQAYDALEQAKEREAVAKSVAETTSNVAIESENMLRAVLTQAVDNANFSCRESSEKLSAAQTSAHIAAEESESAALALHAARVEKQSAESEYAAAIAFYPEVESASSDLLAAKTELVEATASRTSAVSAVSSTRDLVGKCTESVSECEENLSESIAAVDSIEKDLSSEQSRLDNASARLSELRESVLPEALQSVSSANGDLEKSRQSREAAQSELTAARENLESVSSLFQQAESRYDQSVAGLSESEADRTAAAENLAAARAAHERVSRSVSESEDAVTAAEQALSSAEADSAAAAENEHKAAHEHAIAASALESAQELLNALRAENPGQTVVSLYDFFYDMESMNALSAFTRTYGGQVVSEVTNATSSGTPGDATDYRNVLLALDTIRELNDIRAAIGLEELRITDDLMARETVSVNWSAVNIAHSLGSGAENLAWGWDDPVSGWYDYEKEIYDSALENGSVEIGYREIVLEDGWEKMTPSQLSKAYPEFYIAVGHYLNVVSVSFRYVGAAVNTESDTIGTIACGQSYSASTRDKQSFTPDEWEIRFMSWVNGQLAEQDDGNDPVSAAEIAVANAKKDQKSAYDALVQAQSENQAASDRLAAAKKSQDDAGIGLNLAREDEERYRNELLSAVGSMEAAEASYQAALSEFRSSESGYSAAQRAVEGAGVRFSAAEEAYADCVSGEKDYEDALMAAQSAYDEAVSEEQRIAVEAAEAEERISSLSAGLSQAVAEQKTCEDNLSEARSLLVTAENSLSVSEERLSAAESAVKKAIEEVSVAQSVYDSLGDKRQKVEAPLSRLVSANEELSVAERRAEAAVAARELAESKLMAVEAETARSNNNLETVFALSADDLMSGNTGIEDLPDWLSYLGEYVSTILENRTAAVQSEQEAAIAADDVAAARETYDKANDEWVHAVAVQAQAQTVFDTMNAAAEAGNDSENDDGAPKLSIIAYYEMIRRGSENDRKEDGIYGSYSYSGGGIGETCLSDPLLICQPVVMKGDTEICFPAFGRLDMDIRTDTIVYPNIGSGDNTVRDKLGMEIVGNDTPLSSGDALMSVVKAAEREKIAKAGEPGTNVTTVSSRTQPADMDDRISGNEDDIRPVVAGIALLAVLFGTVAWWLVLRRRKDGNENSGKEEKDIQSR